MVRGRHEEGFDLYKKSRGVRSMLDQSEVWVDREGKTHRIAEMESRYASNVVQFLLRRAGGLSVYYGMAQAFEVDDWVQAFGEPDDFDIPLPEDEWEEAATEPQFWLIKKPLLRALSKRAQEELETV